MDLVGHMQQKINTILQLLDLEHHVHEWIMKEMFLLPEGEKWYLHVQSVFGVDKATAHFCPGDRNIAHDRNRRMHRTCTGFIRYFARTYLLGQSPCASELRAARP